jgi:Zn ribbon nucleic-acid-binding protein
MIPVFLVAPSDLVRAEAECPACHHVSVYDLMLPQHQETAVCPQCGHRWTEQYEAVASLRRSLEIARRADHTIRLRLRNG